MIYINGIAKSGVFYSPHRGDGEHRLRHLIRVPACIISCRHAQKTAFLRHLSKKDRFSSRPACEYIMYVLVAVSTECTFLLHHCQLSRVVKHCPERARAGPFIEQVRLLAGLFIFKIDVNKHTQTIQKEGQIKSTPPALLFDVQKDQLQRVEEGDRLPPRRLQIDPNRSVLGACFERAFHFGGHLC